jgi:hypothetical protein
VLHTDVDGLDNIAYHKVRQSPWRVTSTVRYVLAHRSNARPTEPLAASLEIFQRVEDSAGIALTLMRQGMVAEMQGNWATAAQFEEGLTLFRRTGSP